MPKMSESSFVTVDIESPVAVPVRKQDDKIIPVLPSVRMSYQDAELVDVPFFKSILMRKILLITAVLTFFVLLAILLAFATTR
ncbi:hypothetical protein ATCV1_Z723R [Acanthocystis turfacea chlorella virus 1]|uniref:Uncharacterized protein Z723R n=1 Tax=Chlorovirus heliozoae TaxID=322019 RepID=A7K9Y3_9PHYC|nr:hypothetical protein ATCV1_Z723R [Acanthocystis turfacea chlorella virus 1]ABT16857.1 hypothetical protein ATCV1_Z723R [Acanthocystis turfacea chlorella virus 1]AGE60218.1 hypothetical protein ATCVWI0606_821R [Acanthocystis turfacea Chlorella virus WI0606]